MKRETGVRVGFGFDAHRFAKGRKLVLGGVLFPKERGLAGHSDADVLSHAVTDAVLGAAGLGDMGAHFPDTDRRWRGADSLGLLKEAVRLAAARGKRAVNADVTLIGEKPRIAAVRRRMEANLARALGISAAGVNVKGKTTEGMGFTGQGEGLAAMAVVLLENATRLER